MISKGRLVAWATLIVLIGGQSLMQFSSSAAPQLSLLRMLRFDPAHAGTAAGLAVLPRGPAVRG